MQARLAAQPGRCVPCAPQPPRNAAQRRFTLSASRLYRGAEPSPNPEYKGVPPRLPGSQPGKPQAQTIGAASPAA
ncbi:hypothetical protein Busp01_39420 [Trinickia caryophylli]|nr:hypothetical protein Busp01_39420 [Trinickia caryophylli]